uniref:Uncharacterized protein n=1 Tax=Ralstonia solanacearum TaxID=305 RepID=A0A0S4VTD4_RALSL|nr:protein of unknown function [Ralstonia solanacearum]CUV38853.1 protein of unknown function [Ralstonia solanacearum]CUV62796.1 protein of unknown function [Ralstonia solanacearum]
MVGRIAPRCRKKQLLPNRSSIVHFRNMIAVPDSAESHCAIVRHIGKANDAHARLIIRRDWSAPTLGDRTKVSF